MKNEKKSMGIPFFEWKKNSVYALLVVLCILRGVMMAAVVQRFSQILNSVGNGERGLGGQMFVCLVLIALNIALVFLSEKLKVVLSRHLNGTLLRSVCYAAARLDASRAQMLESGQVSGIITTDLPFIVDFTVLFIPNFIYNLAAMIVAFVVLVRINLLYVLYALAMIALSYMVLRFITPRMGAMRSRERKTIGRLEQNLRSMAHNIMTIQIFSSQVWARGKIEAQIEENTAVSTKILKSQNAIYAGSSFIQLIPTLFAVIAISLDPGMGIGTFLLLIQFSGLLLTPVAMLGPLIQSLGQWSAATAHLKLLLDGDRTAIKAELAVSGDKTLASLSQATYEHAPGTGIIDASMRIDSGDVIFLDGANGSGKSTLMRVLSGELPLQEGFYAFGGTQVTSAYLDDLWRHVAVLPQTTYLFTDTVWNNLAFQHTLSVEEVESVTRAIGLHDIILTLPEGYQTVLHPEDMPLSIGQQRLMVIARFLIAARTSHLLLLDEPLAGLDSQIKPLVLAQLQQLLSDDRAMVLITHTDHDLFETMAIRSRIKRYVVSCARILAKEESVHG